MPKTYEPIATTTLGSTAASTTFTSIPSTYTDLVIVINGYLSGDVNVYLQFNSDTASNYSATGLFGSGSAASSFRTTSATLMGLGGIFTSANGDATYHVFNYANTTTNKTVLARANHASSGTQARVGLWRSTAAITSILIGAETSTFASGTVFTIYGIKAA